MRYVQPKIQLMLELEVRRQRRDRRLCIGVKLSLDNLASFFLDMPGWYFPYTPQKTWFTMVNLPLVRRKYPQL